MQFINKRFYKAYAVLAVFLLLSTYAQAKLPSTDPIGAVIEAAESKAVIQKNETQEYKLPPLYYQKEVTLSKRDTLSSLLIDENIPKHLTARALHKLQRAYNVKKLRPGQKVTLSFKDTDTKSLKLDSIFFYGPDDKTVEIVREGLKDFKVNVGKRTLNKEIVAITGIIDDSLYMSAKKAELPVSLVSSFANLFAWELDFTRDIRPSASFKVAYERILDEKGNYLRSGHILAAELTTKGKTYDAFRTVESGWAEYYSSRGYNKKRTLLRTPLEFARISSHYNLKRKHPVLGYTRAHKGTDFAAPTGTPIRAAGDGVVEKAAWYGGYGRYIRIRHDKKFKTAYAHLSRYAKGMKTGKKVKQGQTIGYVGTSGRSTGPHLHYEVFVYGKQVNAMKVKLPTSAKVKKKGLQHFNTKVTKFQKMWKDAQEARIAKIKH
jgi:murein DD-endopeptidase MepM/ murein hydrolase activator NlpD